ncbi:MAG: hypothetical protein JWM85_852 [Acidimicrobiaceae bacterium]|nr:hypothetical protein [Acidimicrobiaceae bacterium]
MRTRTRDERGTRNRHRPPKARLAAVGLAASLPIVLTGCLSTGFAYFTHHSSDNTQLYFKLPSRWKTFDSAQVIEATNGKLSRSQIKTIEAGAWLLYFSASSKTKLKDVGNPGSRQPEGEAFARQLGTSERDTMSLSALRQTFLGTDPLSSTSNQFNVLSYNEFTKSGGIRGSKMVVDISGKNGLVTTFGQVVAVDPQTNWLFGIELSCRASCWGPNTGLINQILTSWTVKELAR